MLNKGLRQYRFPDNPLEERFALVWEKHNRKYSTESYLEYLLSNDNDRVQVSERDRTVAATIIQWLGSSVGQQFLSDVLGIDIHQ